MLADLESLILDSLASIRCDELFRGFHYGKEFEGLSFRSGKKQSFQWEGFIISSSIYYIFGKPSIEEDTQILLTNAAHFLEYFDCGRLVQRKMLASDLIFVDFHSR